ncbi:MAG: endonuclease III domain-containing protein [Candidatus Acidiferrales bacterium]
MRVAKRPRLCLDLHSARRYRGKVTSVVASPEPNHSPAATHAGDSFQPLAASPPPSGRVAEASVRSLANTPPPLDEYYNALFTHFGPQHWWPGKTPFEIIVGAILTQNTSWSNVEKAIANLHAAKLLRPAAIENVSLRKLERMVRPSGYFRQKARKLKAFCAFLRAEYRGSLKRMFSTPTIVLRQKLLGVFGVGPETADSILLYAGGHSVFVVDAYAKRMLIRHGWADESTKYEDLRWTFERQFPGDARRFNELHALIVTTGKNFCRRAEPLCGRCPLGRYREEGR